tara:strand:+ start:265 stop:873 length:609 start_codon:yes stop_codon:yes gene_type:complete
MKSIQDQQNLVGKKVLLRLDLNVPLKEGVIKDATRITKIIPILNFLLEKKAKIIILSHVGRPKGRVNPELTMKPICEYLKKKINGKIDLITEDIRKIKDKNLFKNLDKNILILENIRFYSEEENNDLDFAKHLAGFGDIYVNDAFSCSHRAHASVTNITKFLPSYAGLQLNSEVNALQKVTTNIKNLSLVLLEDLKFLQKLA